MLCVLVEFDGDVMCLRVCVRGGACARGVRARIRQFQTGAGEFMKFLRVIFLLFWVKGSLNISEKEKEFKSLLIS